MKHSRSFWSWFTLANQKKSLTFHKLSRPVAGASIDKFKKTVKVPWVHATTPNIPASRTTRRYRQGPTSSLIGISVAAAEPFAKNPNLLPTEKNLLQA
jgi:hypothetical protein